MKGYNELRICQTQMVAMMQEWWDRYMQKKATVTQVTLNRDSSSSLADHFVVVLQGEEEES
jgi:hypothetical protein